MVSAAPLLSLALGCGGGPSIGTGESAPHRDEWQTVIDWPAFDPSGVERLRIGGDAPFNRDNFEARGDVEVYYTLPDDRIVVQMRRFGFGSDEAEARSSYELLGIWAFVGTEVNDPDEIDPNRACTFETAAGQPLPWPDDCWLRVHYDGQTQPRRVGADLRVFLPAVWDGEVDIIAQDNDFERDDYPDQADVRLHNLRGSASVLMGSGRAYATLAGDLEPTRNCSPADTESCEASGWDAACPCSEFHHLLVQTRDERAANVTVDLPPSLWSYISTDNGASGLDADDPESCRADLRCEELGDCELISADPIAPWKVVAALNRPSETSTAGWGYRIDLQPNACDDVPFVESPEDHQAPLRERRGNVIICSGCTTDFLPPPLPG